jgi:hypothetical protein
MNAADKIAYLINNSNLQPTTKSFIGSVLKDFGQNFDEEGYETEAKEHNEGEMDVIAQLQDLLQQLMEMEGEEMEGEEMEMEAEEEDEDEEDEEEFEFGEKDEEGEDEEEDVMGGGSVKIMRGMF